MSRIAWPGMLVAVVAAVGCKSNPKYCEGNPGNNCDLMWDGGETRCSTSQDCSGIAATPVCDVTGSMTCVQCTPAEDDACMGATPACIDNTCQGCTAHAQCTTSDVCLPDGSCADGGQVAYVQAGGSGTACTKTAPCGTLENGVNANKPYVKLATGLVSDNKLTTIDGKAVTLLADPGAKLDRSGDGSILEVRSANADVRIFDLEITGQTGLADSAISIVPNGGVPKLSLTRVKVTNNQGGGISSTGGTLTVTQSTISSNQGGGLSSTNGTFVIVGNVFLLNGAGGSLAGAVVISAPANASNRLEFNSFNQNTTTNGVASAIQCTIAGVFTARNNIMSENGTLTNMEQVGGNCMHTYSIARPGTLPPGAGNSAMDPLFTNTTTGDLHLRAGSPALRAADPNSDLTGPAARDLDGDVRMSPADIGADEAP